MNYRTVPVPEGLVGPINGMIPFTKDIENDHSSNDHYAVQDDRSRHTSDGGRTRSDDVDNSEDESYNELTSSQQLDYIEPNVMLHHEKRIVLMMGSNNSTNMSVINPSGMTNTSTLLQCLFIQYLRDVVTTIMSLQPSLPVSLLEDILHHLYKGISTDMYLLSSLPTSLRSEFLQSSLRIPLRNEIIRSSLLASLRRKQSCLLIYLQIIILQSSQLTSLRSKFKQSPLLTPLWNRFLRPPYEDISTITPILSKPKMFVQGIHSKPEIRLQNIRGFVNVLKQVKSGTRQSWLPSRSLLQPYTKSFYKFITYYMNNHVYNINTWNIRIQLTGFIMSLKRKRRMKLKAKGCAEGRYHHIFKHILTSNPNLVQSNTHEGCCMINTMDYNYKLRSVLGREDSHTNMTWTWTWFNQQVRDTFLCSWMISRSLVDYSNMGSAIGRILDKVYAPSVSMIDSVGSKTSFFHTSMVLHPGSNGYFCIRKFIPDGLLSSLSKKQQNGKVLINNVVLGVDYKLTINMLMKQLYIAVQYFYITNQLISGKISKAIYKPTNNMKSNHFTETIQGELIDINELELNEMHSTKSIVSKRV